MVHFFCLHTYFYGDISCAYALISIVYFFQLSSYLYDEISFAYIHVYGDFSCTYILTFMYYTYYLPCTYILFTYYGYISCAYMPLWWHFLKLTNYFYGHISRIPTYILTSIEAFLVYLHTSIVVYMHTSIVAF